MVQTEVPEVEWRAFSEGKLGGVMAQLLNNGTSLETEILSSAAALEKAGTHIPVGFQGPCQTGYVMANDIRNFREIEKCL